MQFHSHAVLEFHLTSGHDGGILKPAEAGARFMAFRFIALLIVLVACFNFS